MGNQNESASAESVGRDLKSLSGWDSFRYGKQGRRIKRAERMARSRTFQLKRRTRELRRSKREGRRSELDLFSIRQKRDTLKVRKTWKKGGLKQKKKKKKKEAEMKISKGLRKRLSTKEQTQFKAKKRSWFGDGKRDIV